MTIHDNLLLRELAGHANPANLRALLAAGADVANDDNAALRFACSRGQIANAQALLEAGAIPEEGLLSLAIRNNQIGIARLLLQHGVALNAAHLLQQDVMDSLNVETMALLINHGFPLASAELEPGLRAVDFLAYVGLAYGKQSIFVFAVALGAEVQRIVRETIYPLFERRANGHLTIKELLPLAEIARAMAGLAKDDLVAIAQQANLDVLDHSYHSVRLFEDWISGKFDLMTAAELDGCEAKYELRP